MKEIANALQEAKTLLEKIRSAYSDSQGDISLCSLRKVIKVVDEALAKPLRNCDVGTVAEQTKRLRANCERFKPTYKGCKCFTDIQEENCWLKWAQMPYESEVK